MSLTIIPQYIFSRQLTSRSRSWSWLRYTSVRTPLLFVSPFFLWFQPVTLLHRIESRVTFHCSSGTALRWVYKLSASRLVSFGVAVHLPARKEIAKPSVIAASTVRPHKVNGQVMGRVEQLRQLTNQRTSQSVSHSVNQSVRQSVSQSASTQVHL